MEIKDKDIILITNNNTTYFGNAKIVGKNSVVVKNIEPLKEGDAVATTIISPDGTVKKISNIIDINFDVNMELSIKSLLRKLINKVIRL